MRGERFIGFSLSISSSSGRRTSPAYSSFATSHRSGIAKLTRGFLMRGGRFIGFSLSISSSSGRRTSPAYSVFVTSHRSGIAKLTRGFLMRGERFIGFSLSISSSSSRRAKSRLLTFCTAQASQTDRVSWHSRLYSVSSSPNSFLARGFRAFLEPLSSAMARRESFADSYRPLLYISMP